MCNTEWVCLKLFLSSKLQDIKMEKNERKETLPRRGDGRIEEGKEKERTKKKFLNVGKKGARVHAVPLTYYIVRS